MSEKFVAKFRFGCKPNLPGLGLRGLLFLKLTPMYQFQHVTIRKVFTHAEHDLRTALKLAKQQRYDNIKVNIKQRLKEFNDTE